MDAPKPAIELHGKTERPFRKAVLGGLGVLFPPLLTVLIFVWIINTTYRYVLDPVTSVAREALVVAIGDIRTTEDLGVNDPDQNSVSREGYLYRRVDEKSFIPEAVYETVAYNPGDPPPQTAKAYYRRYIDLTYLEHYYTVPFTLTVFLLLLYLLGRFMAAGIGHFFWSSFEELIRRLPLVRNVYSAVKQVSDFLFSQPERELEYTRVVAVEYPRKGMWSLAFVTSEGMAEIASAVKEPVLTLFLPASPMMTGYAVTVPKRETLDMNISVDQAIQFLVSFGVVIPPSQLRQMQGLPAVAAPESTTPTEPRDAATNPAAATRK